MKDQLDFIYKRRSIRKYQDRAIGDDILKELLEAAMAAPSAVAKDPWRFVVTKNKETLSKIAEELSHGKMLNQAGAAIVVCGDIEVAHESEVSYMLQDCSAAIQNILLSATALGLGSCWLGVHPREKPEDNRMKHIRDLFYLPENIIPISVISLGYPAEDKSLRSRYREEYVHYERW